MSGRRTGTISTRSEDLVDSQRADGYIVAAMHEKVDLSAAFASFTEHWRPKVVAELNGQDVRVVKVQGVFPWHSHAEAEELFLVWRGRLRIELRDRVLSLGPGELFVVPRGVEHRTAADEETEVLIFEPSEVVNTGDLQDETYTAPRAKL